jgi:hypothetical protein
MLREAARAKLELSLGNWDAELKGRGFAGPKGPYLLSGFPGQFLDDLADRAARDIKLSGDKVNMFQSRYVNDAPFRASVNRGLKAKVPGILAAGLGTYAVKERMNEGDSLPQAVVGTIGDALIGAAKFATYERFTGPIGELGAPERDPNEAIRQRSPDGMTPYERQRKNSNDAFQAKINSMTTNDWNNLEKHKDTMAGRKPRSDREIGDELRDRIASGDLTEKERAQMNVINKQMLKVENEKKTLEQVKAEQAQKTADHIMLNMSMSPLWNR